ncbi:integrase [Klebsiella pneumoniae]|uniref:Integrase n=1 Tax=Klebsiella pneumoniae TaxID=573 RepID=A0A2X3F4W2_KLEPN|nr:integrase [Klebsiella pneumoniae]
MLMQHIGVGYFGYYRATAYAMKHSLMPEIAKLRMKALTSGISTGSVPQLMLLTYQREHSTGGAGYCAPVVQKH